jgi:triacylglycerol lipase
MLSLCGKLSGLSNDLLSRLVDAPRTRGRIMVGMRILRWWTGLSPRRKLLLAGLVVVVAVAGVIVGVRVSQGPPQAVPGRPGDVLLVPGYGGSATSLDGLAARIRQTGRTATVVQLAGNGTGDLAVQARVLDGYVNQAIGAGSGPVTVIGYSAGGVVAWLWDVEYGGPARAGTIITLGSPLHGARIAAVGTAYDPAECPVACQQLVPGSALLTQLQQSSQPRPPWLSLWSTDDQTVDPPDSARQPGAVNVPLQSVCPGADIQHSQLPTAPLVVGIILRTLASGQVTAPDPGDCATMQALGSLARDVLRREVRPGGPEEHHDIDRLDAEPSVDISPEDGLPEEVDPRQPVPGRQVGLHGGGRVQGDEDLAADQGGQRPERGAERGAADRGQEQRDGGDAEHRDGDEGHGTEHALHELEHGQRRARQ